jgi:hypothetical protein
MRPPGDEAALARIREVTGCGDNAEEVLRWMLEAGGDMLTGEEFDEEARVSWSAVQTAAMLVYGPRSEAAPGLPRARDFAETSAAEWETYLRRRGSDA